MDFPILVLGLNGVPGYALFRYFRTLYPGKVIGIRPVKRPCVFGADVRAVDADGFDALARLYEEFQFKTVIDAGGNCALKNCECNPAISRLLNYTQGVDSANLSAKYGAKIIRISTDMVFSGKESKVRESGYIETDAKDPIHNYGKDQAEAEDEILKIKSDTVILRIPLPMDYAPGGEAGAIDWISYRFRPERPATLFTDELRNPIFGIDLCKVVHFILTHEFPPGIYNCGGKRVVSLYQVGQLVNAVGCYTPHLLKGVPRIEGGAIPPRVGNLHLNSEKLYRLLPEGFIRPWPFDDSLVPTDFDWHKTVDRGRWNNKNNIDALLVKGTWNNLET